MLELFVNISRLSPLIASIINFILGAVVFSKNHKSKRNIIFFIFSLSLSFWAFCCFVQSVTINFETALLWDKFMYTVAVYVPVLVLVLTNSYAKQRLQPFFIGGYIFATILMISNWAGLFREGVDYNFGARFITTASYGLYIYLVFFGIFFSLSCYQMYIKFRQSEPNQRLPFLYLFVSMFVLLIAGNSYFLLILKKINPVVDSFLNLNSSFLLGVYSIIMTYLILKENVLDDIKLIIGKTAAWVVTLIIAGVSFGVTAFALKNHPIESNVALSALGLAWTFGGGWFQQRVITGNYYKFVKGYESAKLISQISKTLSTQTSASAMFENLVALLHHELQIEHIAYYVGIRNQESEIVRYRRVYSLPNSPLHSESEVAIDDSFIAKLKPVRQPLLLSLILDTVSSDVQTLFEIEKFSSDSVCLPLHSSPNLLEGVVVVEQRAGKRNYTKYDLDFFSALIDTASSLLLPLSPYEKLRKEFAVTQKRVYDSEINAARSEKAGFLQDLIRGYGHEMRSTLTLIKKNLNLSSTLPEFVEAKQVCLETVADGFKILDTTLDLFRHEQNLVLSPIQVNDVIQSVASEMNRTLDEKVKMVLDLGVIPTIQAVAQQAPLIFSNIIKNAVEFMPNGGIIKIRSRLDEDDPTRVRVDISDTGAGMSAETLSRIWDPFFTTHTYGGRGNGLALVNRYIQDHKGHIEVKSDIGKGATFSIFFLISSSK